MPPGPSVDIDKVASLLVGAVRSTGCTCKNEVARNCEDWYAGIFGFRFQFCIFSQRCKLTLTAQDKDDEDGADDDLFDDHDDVERSFR